MPKLLLFPVCMLFISLNSNAQGNFSEGHVVLLQGDTLKGSLMDPNWEKSPKEITFKKSDGSVAKFGVTDISSFRYATGLRYKRIIATIDKTPTDAGKIEDKRNKSYVAVDTVFAEVLVVGKCDLYYAMDETAKRHYFIEKDNKVSELGQKLVVTESGTTPLDKEKVITRVDVYKGQLAGAFQECASLKDRINKAKLERTNLIDLVNDYNACSGGSSSYVNRDKVNVFEFGVAGGLSMTKLDFSGKLYANLVSGDFPTSYNPSLGLWFTISSAKNKQRVALYSELIYRAYQTQITVNSFGVTTYTVDMSYLKINCALRYLHPGEKVRPFGQAGLGYGIALHNESPLLETQSRNFEACVFAGGGVRLGKIGTELRYEFSNGFSELVDLKSKVTTLFFLVSYKF